MLAPKHRASAKLPIIRADRNKHLPLSFAQQRLWFLAQMEGVSQAYHIPLDLRLKGDLDRTVLRQALDRILVRHEALRTTFAFVDEQPVQQIARVEDSRFILLEHDLRQHPDAEKELHRLTAEEASASFDLEHGRLIRGRLIRLAEDEYALLITMHHIVSDGWSIDVLVHELSTLYGAFLHGKDDPLPELEIQYADYAVWQRKWIEGDILQQQAAYWKTALAGAPALLELPADHRRPARQDFAGAIAELELDEKLTVGLKELSRRHGITLFMTLLAVWAALLARLSGQQDVIVGSPVANRGRVEIEPLIGFFVNTLALRLDLSGSSSVSELLGQVRVQALAALQHQDIPFEQVVELAQPMRSLAHSPLFQVMFAWQNAAEGSLKLPGLELRSLESSTYRVAKFDLTLSLQETDNTIAGGIEYATSLFKPATIERYLSHFRTLLEAMVADESQSIEQLPLLTEAERHKVLYEWNDTRTAFPDTQCIHQLFEEQVEKTPAAIAVRFEEASLSYEELNRRANQLAHYLRELGIRPDDRVALCVERGFEMIIALLAILKAGGAYVPLDPAYPPERLRFMLQDSDPVALITQGHLRGLFTELDNGLPFLDPNDENAPWKHLPGTNLDPQAIGLKPQHLAYVIYTSGSSGNPKGVLVEHRGVSNHLYAKIRDLGLSHLDKVAQTASPCFDISVWQFWAALLVGGKIVLATEEEAHDPTKLIHFLSKYEVTVFETVPLMLDAILQQPRTSECDLSKIRSVLATGESLSTNLGIRWVRAYGTTNLFNAYGPTECSDDVTHYVLTYPFETSALNIPIGRPIANTQIYILDAHRVAVPIGVTGELYIGGAGVARGYLNRPELTAERFLPDLFSSEAGARMYRTGDLGRWLPDGNIEFLGRNDFQVKIRGFRIELGEIEARLREHPSIREAFVIAREDTPGDKRLVAYYTASFSDAEESPAAEHLRAYLAEKLPEYMVPAAFVLLEAFPLTPNGKLDRKALPAPETDAFAVRAYEAPQGETETAIAALWMDLLKIDRIGRNDNFFELGGHSLLAVRVISSLQQSLKIKVNLSDLFAHPTLADFAFLLEKSVRTELLPITPIDRNGPLPLSFAQQRLWFLAQMEGVSEIYHIPLNLRFSGRLNHAVLRRALNRIVARHETLRTTFHLLQGEPVQRITPVQESQFFLLEHDLGQHSNPEEELYRLTLLEAGSSFHLATGPLIRGRLVRLSDEDHALLLTMHHIVSDGWSIDVLVHELSTLYGAFLHGKDDPLPELEIQYADYAVWQRKWIEGDILQQQAAYWKTALAGAPALLELPADHRRPARQGFAGAFAPLQLDEKLTTALKELSRRHGITLYMTMLTAWTILLARLSGQRDIVTGTPVANRSRAEIENLIGFFVNTLVLRIDLSDSPSVVELLARVKNQTLEALQHQDIPFEQVVEIMRPVRSLAHSPLFQVMFSWQNTEPGTFDLPALERKPVAAAPHILAKFDLTLSLEDTGDSIVGGLEYATVLFESSTIERYLSHFRTLLEAMVADESQSIEQLPLLTEAERHKVLYEWNDTRTAFPDTQCIHQLFEEQVEKTPAAIAVRFEEASLSYEELNRRANQLAHYLRELGIRPDDRVALCVERGFEMIIALLAILKAGGAYVPLDPAYPPERLRFMLQDSDPVALITQSNLTHLFPDRNQDLPLVDLQAPSPAWQQYPQHNPDPQAIGLKPQHLAYVIYTSGSSGNPKGVLVEHRNVIRLVRNTNYIELFPDDVIAQAANISFDAATFEIWGALLNGASIAIIRLGELLSFLEAAGKYPSAKINILFLTTALFNQVACNASRVLDNLRYLLFGGELVDPRWVSRVLAKIKLQNLLHVYGPTETTTYASWYRVLAVREGLNIPIGRPIANTQIYILDAHRVAVPIGVTGELYIGGAGVARGYLNRPELTAERFLPDLFSSEAGARMYRTGDLGRWLPDGNIEFLGRNDFQVKIRGFRIELGEIEARLREHPSIREAFVIAREDTPGDKRLVAYYTASFSDAEESPAAEHLRAYLAEKLPEYMVPAAFVLLEAFPLTPNGKLDRKALPAPETDAFAVRAYEAPQGETETAIAALWMDLLKIDRIGRNDNFFELGGHSLLAVRVISSLQQSLKIKVNLSDLFAHPTLADFAFLLEKSVRTELLPITPIDRNGPLPLSFAQQRLWFLAQMEGVSEIYHIPLNLRFSGRLNHAVLRRALNRIVARHETLRTTFHLLQGEPVQRITPVQESQFFLLEHDLGQHSNPEEELYRLTLLEAGSSFHLATGPLIRGRLVRLSDEDHALLLTMHHIAFDGWSTGIFSKELRMLYAAFLENRADPLPELTVQYADYAAWQRKWVEGEVLQQQIEYWKNNLAGAPALLELPTDHPRPLQQGFAGAFAPLQLDEKLTTALKELSRRHGITLYMTMLTAWTILLARLSGQRDIVTGTPVANRSRAEIENLIGFFVNTLVLRIDLSDSPSVVELLARVKNQTLEAQQHQDIPFEQVVEIMRPVRSLAHSPLFQVMFSWQNTEPGTFDLPALERKPVAAAPHILAKFDLTLSLEDTGDSIVGGLEYATVLFESSTIERYLSHFRTLLEAMVADESQSIEQLPLLTEAERHKVLYEWNDTRTAFPDTQCIHQLFEEQVEKTPAAIAVRFEEASLSYEELNRRANQLAHYLRELGIRPDDRVALCVERGFEMIIALLAILKAGGAYVPLDPAYPPERLRFMLQDSDPVALITQSNLTHLFPDRNQDLPLVDLQAPSPAWQQYPQHNPDPQAIGLKPQHLAYVIYTSGSSGNPKGVLVEHRNVIRLVRNTNYIELFPDDVIAQAANISFDAATFEIWGALLNGASIAIISRDISLQIKSFKAALRQHAISTLWLGVGLFNQISGALADEFSRLRYLIVGGDVLDSTIIAKVLHSMPPQYFLNGYGPTESATFATTYRIPDSFDSALNIPIGRPIANTQIYILDAHRVAVPIGVTGELYIGGAGVARGYLNRPELTAERFLPDLFSSEAGARMYRTGDLGRWLPDGNIEFLGRNDFQVKIRGFRIELGEIEARLREHPSIREAFVIAREDTPGDKRLVAYYTASFSDAEESPAAEHLRAYLAEKLPEYMVPAAFVLLEAFPLTPNGKLDRKALPAPETDAFAVRAYEAPQGETETAIAALWMDLLKIDRIGRNDNFFELGGHSLLAVTLIERMRQSGLHIDVRAVFATPTLAAFAASVNRSPSLIEVPENRIPADSTAITPEMLPLVQLGQEEIDRIVSAVPGGAANIQDIYPLAPLQEGILFHHLVTGEGDPYLLASQLSFDTRTRLDNYLLAMQGVIDRHDILRTAILWEGLSTPVQVVLRHAELSVTEVALDSRGESAAKQLYARFDPRLYRIDIRQAPLLRTIVAYDEQNDRWLMMLLRHHLSGDHNTLEIMQEEIQAHLLGHQDRLPVPLPFRNLVAQARLGVSQEEHERFFRKMLGNIDEPTAPFGLLDVQGDGSAISEARLKLDSKLALGMRQQARRLGVSPATLCHLAWAQVLASIAGRDEVVFGTVLFGRMQAGKGSDRVMGLFINTLPICIHVGQQGVEDGVRHTHTLLAELMHHEHASLAMAQRCSAVPAPTPLFSSLLNYRHSPKAARPDSADERRAWEGIDWLYSGERTNYPLTLSVDDLGDSFYLTVQVDDSIEPMRICHFMRTALEKLTETLHTSPTTPLHTLNALPEAERHKVLYEWNDTRTAFPDTQCIHQLFEEQVEKTPAAIAVRFEEASLSYEELNRRANQLAHYLRELGIRPDDRVALCVERGFEMIIALLAILKAGGAYVPLDPAYPPERLRFMLQDSDPVALITQSNLTHLFPDRNQDLPLVDLQAPSPAWQQYPQHNPDPQAIGLKPQHLAYVIYTSGSSGNPKGVLVEHRNVTRLFTSTNIWFQFSQDDVWILLHSYAFDFSVWEIWGALLYSGRLIIAPKETVRSPAALFNLLCTEKVTFLNQTPSAFKHLIEAQAQSSNSHHLKYVVFGGESLEVASLKPWYERNSGDKPQLVNMYGITETTVHVTYRPLAQPDSENQKDKSIGCHISDLQIYILDAHRVAVPIGVTGELYIGGAGVARGYLNRPELTAERFLPDLFSSEAGARMYRTGDLGRWLPDGNIEFLGRNDFQVKIRGFRIELGEIEARLREHPSIREAFVIAREDTPGDKRLVAYYTASFSDAEESPAAEHLRAYLAEKLPEYMVPAAFVLLEAFPLTPNGKLDRKALPAPETDAFAVRAYEAPQGETETAIAALWMDLLKIDRIGRNDNFFELGGHSLLAVRVISSLQQSLKIKVNLSDLFAHPTLADFAEQIVNMQLQQFSADELNYSFQLLRSFS